jgi:hypothetical protein
VLDNGVPALSGTATVTVNLTNVNEAPVVNPATFAVNENSANGTVVGTVMFTDPDAGQTHTFSITAGNTGGAFAINAGTGQITVATTAALNFEVTPSFSLTVQVTDNGVPAPVLSGTATITVNLTNVNDAPVAQDKSYTAQANMKIATPVGSGLLVGATDEDSPAQVLSVGTVSATTPAGGTVTVNAATGAFDFDPPAGVTGAVTFTYTVCDDGSGFGGVPVCSAAKTVTFTVASPVIWFVAPNLGANGAGTLFSPFNVLASANTAKGTNASHRIFVYHSTTPATGVTTEAGVGVTLDAAGGQWLAGQGVTGTSFDTVMGLTVPAGTIARPGINGTRPVIQGTVAMNGNTSVVRGLNITPSVAGAAGLTGGAVTGVTTGEVSVTTGTGTAVNLNGTGGTVDLGNVTSTGGTAVSINAGSGTVTVGGTVSRTGAAATGITVTNRTSGTVTFSGATKTLNTATSPAVSLSTNTGATINFTNGGLDIDTTSGAGFSATGGGTVNVTGTGNTINSGTGTALTVTNTTIGASGMTFQSISANGAPNGILLNNTGATGGLTVTGSGNTTVGGDNSGGTIQNTTGFGISLTTTFDPSFTNVRVMTTVGHGVGGTDVTNFTYHFGRIDDSNADASTTTEEANIGFYVNETNSTRNNLDGIVSIVGNQLTNAEFHGIDIFNFSGTITGATISNNTITSSTSTATSKGGGIRLVAFGSATTIANVTLANITNNVVSNFPSGFGIQAQGGNGNLAGPAGVFGTAGHATNKITITGNTLTGNPKFGTFAIVTAVNGRGQGNFDISNNGTAANPITNSIGAGISVGSFGFANVTATINNNVIVANNQAGAQGIGAGTSITLASTETPSLEVTITNNTISATDGNGILVTARDGSGSVRAKIQNNTVAAPLAGNRNGIRLDAGNGVSINDSMCANISGNTSAGSGLAPEGIGLRKEGTVAGTNNFAIHGLATSPATGAQVVTFVGGNNPGSAANPGTGDRVLIISGNNFNSPTCSFP